MLHKLSIEKFLIGGGVICTFVGGIALWQDHKNQKATLEPSYKYSNDLTNKVYLVTGANTGKRIGNFLENTFGPIDVRGKSFKIIYQ